jgi:hypothetical protein
LHGGFGFAIVRVLLLQRSKSNRLKRTAEKDEVDELSELLHNLSSLLLTNKTIRQVRQGSTEYKFFNNKQSISVGV